MASVHVSNSSKSVAYRKSVFSNGPKRDTLHNLRTKNGGPPLLVQKTPRNNLCTANTMDPHIFRHFSLFSSLPHRQGFWKVHDFISIRRQSTITNNNNFLGLSA